MDTNEKICKRITEKEGGAPTSVIISEQSDARLFVSSFIEKNADIFNEKKIIPIHIPINSFTTALVFWKEMSNLITNKLNTVIENDDMEDIAVYIKEINNYTETGAIMSNLISILNIAKEYGLKILVILEGFDEIGKYMSRDDVYKLREMTSHFIELIISRQKLDVLAQSWFGNDYVVNQFKDPFYI